MYKQVFQFTFKTTKAVFRTNHDYEMPMSEHGFKTLEELQVNPCVVFYLPVRGPS